MQGISRAKANRLDISRRQWADYFDSKGVQYAFFSALDAKALLEAKRMAEVAQDAGVSLTVDEAREELRKEEEESSDEEGEAAGDRTERTENALEENLEALELDDGASGSEGADGSRDGESSEEDGRDPHILKPRDVNEDPRTRVLTVLELEELFTKQAPDLSSEPNIVSSPNCFLALDISFAVQSLLIVQLAHYPPSSSSVWSGTPMSANPAPLTPCSIRRWCRCLQPQGRRSTSRRSISHPPLCCVIVPVWCSLSLPLQRQSWSAMACSRSTRCASIRRRVRCCAKGYRQRSWRGRMVCGSGGGVRRRVGTGRRLLRTIS